MVSKTRIATELIALFRRDDDKRTILVVVPTIVLKKQWSALLKQLNLNINSKVIVINSLIKLSPFKVDLLIIDEVHRAGAETFSRIFDVVTYHYVLGLTATFERLDGKHEVLANYAPIIDKVPMRLAKKEGWVSDYIHYNLGISLDKDDTEIYTRLTETFGRAMDKFNRDFNLMRTCSYGLEPTKWGGEPYVVQYAKSLGWIGNYSQRALNNIRINKTLKAKDRVSIWGNDFHQFSPKTLYIWAIIGMKANRQIMKFIYNHPSKIEAAIELIETFDKRTITFGQYTHTAEIIANHFKDNAVIYHSSMLPEMRKVLIEKEYKTLSGAQKYVAKHKEWTIKQKRGKIFIQKHVDKKISARKLKEEAIHKIKNYKKIKVIATAKALNEGVDLPNIEMGIVLARTSSKVQTQQMIGRTVRKHTFSDGSKKSAIFIDIYLKDTKDYSWLKKAQEGLLGQIWVDSPSQIISRQSKDA